VIGVWSRGVRSRASAYRPALSRALADSPRVTMSHSPAILRIC
jgi:hypothetical protein